MSTIVRIGEPALAFSRHSQARMQQRGITPRTIEVALHFGARSWSHDDVCYRLTERCLCGTPLAAESDRLRGPCVVVTRDGTVRTVKWDFELRRPGPLRRANQDNWRRLRRARAAARVATNRAMELEPVDLPLAA